jgi:polysaccharide export outer membrane protein
MRQEWVRKGKAKSRIWLIMGLITMLASCGGQALTPTGTVQDLQKGQDQRLQEIKALNERLHSSLNAAPQMSDYVLGEGDLMQMSVFGIDDLKAETRIGARGFVSLPLLGSVKLKGLTTREAEQTIENLYKGKYVKDPHVTVFIKEHVTQKITIIGAVSKPGTYDYFGRQRLLDVLALAGGLGEKAGNLIQVRKFEREGEKNRQTLFIDMTELIKKGRAELNLMIERGDIIFVPEAGVFFADGAVRKPGSYPIQESMNLGQAIVAAGGLTPYADSDNIKLVRYERDGRHHVVKFCYSDIEQGGARQIQIQDGDLLFVEASGMGKLVYGLGVNLGIPGLLGLGYKSPDR